MEVNGKKSIRVLACLLIIPCVVIFATTLHGAEWTAWTFNVPVQLTNLPPAITKGEVACYVCKDTPNAFTECTRVSHGHSTPFAISNGSYDGTVIVPVKTLEGIDPYTGKTWLCKVLLQPNTSSQPSYVSQVMTPDPSKPLIDRVSGNLP